MLRGKLMEVVVGLFMLLGMLGLIVLAFKVSGLTQMGGHNYYILTAEFDNIGGLKVRAPVRLSGVTIGRVSSISLDPHSYRALVVLQVNKNMNNIPADTSASILTEGLLGSNYIGFTPGFEQGVLKPGAMIQTTHSALILENLIGQLLFSLKSGK